MPLAGATVEASLQGQVIANATSDAKGRYLIEGLDKGTYAVTASKAGYNSFIKGDLAVQNGFSTTADLSLDPVSSPEEIKAAMEPRPKIDLMNVPKAELNRAGLLLESSARKRGAAFVVVLGGIAAGAIVVALSGDGQGDYDTEYTVGGAIAGVSVIAGTILTFGSVNNQVEAGLILQGHYP
ncbi:MAG: carboxypeptidase regulatory-like domain-containing protein [Flavobacteriales bacterium]|jgi:hypothetical protein|nr:carboxypeptidase regulatory-like domain-containing protein [Flavobacteriales bacterium]